MHGHVEYDVFLQQISGFLGSYYLFLAIANAVAALWIWQSGRDKSLIYIPVLEVSLTTAGIWLLVAILFVLISPPSLPSGPPRPSGARRISGGPGGRPGASAGSRAPSSGWH